MIIWGTKGREKTVGKGQFFCPDCQTNTEYTLQRVAQYFTLYFIPLFPTKQLGEFVSCKSCQNQYDPMILEMAEQEIRSACEPWQCLKCNNMNAGGSGACLSCGVDKSTATD